MVAFLASFVAVTGLFCGLLVLAVFHDDRWQAFTASVVATVREAKRPSDEGQADHRAGVYSFREGVVFAVGYTDDGSVTGNEGICPDQSQIAWLEEFKKAVVACAERAAPPLRLNVRGFASIAPVGAESSDEGNLAIANRRGRVIARFLADESENFADCKPDEPISCPPSSETGDGDCLAKGGSYIVRYRDWPNYRAMRRFSPADDGGRPAPHYPLEFLNRTVHIVVMNNACWQPVSWHWVSDR